MPADRPDLLVVGGGPVGLALAIAARRRGLAVTVLDRGRPPIDKACGEGLMPDGVACLSELGVAIEPAARRSFRGIRFVDGDRGAEGRFPDAEGWGIRRVVLHASLVEAAASAGAVLCWGEEAVAFDAAVPAVRSASGKTWLAATIVAADGLGSRLRRWSGLERRRVARRRFGVRRHLALEPWSDLVEVHFSGEGDDGVEAYVTPVDAGQIGVALLWNTRRGPATFDELIARFPALVERLAGAAALSRDRGAGHLERRVRDVVRGRLALVGDAAGYVDAITGEGMSVGLRQAIALADALGRGDLPAYRSAHRCIVRLPNAIVRAVLALERHARLRRRVLACLGDDPGLFGRLLAVHGGMRPLRTIGLGGAVRLMTACAGSA